MKRSRRRRKPYTLPTVAAMSLLIRRVMNQYSNRDISEDEIFKKLSHHTGLPFEYFKDRRRDILEISDEIAFELGLERDSVIYHQDAIENIFYSTVFFWPAFPDVIPDRKKISEFLTCEIIKIFSEENTSDNKYDLISLDDIFEELSSIPEFDQVDSELLAYSLLEVWNYLLDQGLIT